MTTRRRTIYFSLSALFFFSCAFLGSDGPYRIVRVKALADPAFRERNPGWDQEVRGLVEASSDYFEREFAIRLVTQSTAPWPVKDRIASTAGLLARLKKDFPRNQEDHGVDLIIVFTAERINNYVGGRARVDRIGNCQEGLGNYIVTYVSSLYRYTGFDPEPNIDIIALVHELGHIFGAEHTEDTRSLMHANFDYRAEFDMKNRSVILKNRTCPFAK